MLVRNTETKEDARSRAHAAVANENPNIYPANPCNPYPLHSKVEPLGRLHGKAALI